MFHDPMNRAVEAATRVSVAEDLFLTASIQLHQSGMFSDAFHANISKVLDALTEVNGEIETFLKAKERGEV